MITFLNYIFNYFTNNKSQKVLEDSKKLTSDNYWKQQSIRKDEPIIPATILEEETFLLDHKWEHVLTEEEGCDTWSYPASLRKNWPLAIKHQYGTQHYWDRADAVKLQNEINGNQVRLKLDYQAPIPVVKFKMQEVKGPYWEPCNCLDDNKIRELAYYKWEASGRPEGNSVYFWSLAEQELRKNHEFINS